jgi:hypothetical protein
MRTHPQGIVPLLVEVYTVPDILVFFTGSTLMATALF